MDATALTREMLSFIDESPTAFHAAVNVEEMLKKEGFIRLDAARETENGCAGGREGVLRPGGSYYEMRNGSALIAVRIPKDGTRGFRIVASHSDSPSFKIKETPEIRLEEKYVKLNTEKYGGMILNTWLDRALSAAGRVIVKDEKTGALQTRLVNIKKDLLVIPNVAIHFNREVNDGIKLNPQIDLLPLFSQDQSCTMAELCAQELGIDKEDILGSDLYVYNRDKGRIMGADDAFIGAPRLDDLQCAFASLKGFLAAQPREYIAVYALFDNEEVGSTTKQGADSTFLTDVIEKVFEGLSLTAGRIQRDGLLKSSFLLSADNGHAVHPNHPEKSDPTNRPYINGGVVLKFHGSQRYTTDGYSAAVVRDICREHDIPVQNFVNRADIAGGSTLGNISAAHLSIPSADIGLAQLAMHSAFETAGARDTMYLAKLTGYFYT